MGELPQHENDAAIIVVNSRPALEQVKVLAVHFTDLQLILRQIEIGTISGASSNGLEHCNTPSSQELSLSRHFQAHATTKYATALQSLQHNHAP